MYLTGESECTVGNVLDGQNEEDVAVIPWPPLARGHLTRPHEDFEASDRPKNDSLMLENPHHFGDGCRINKRVRQVAADEGVSMAQIALAWLLHKGVVTAPVIGTTSIKHPPKRPRRWGSPFPKAIPSILRNPTNQSNQVAGESAVRSATSLQNS